METASHHADGPAPEEVTAVRRIQIAKHKPLTRPAEPDLRAPSGRRLPF
jgi:hypothetical protein